MRVPACLCVCEGVSGRLCHLFCGELCADCLTVTLRNRERVNECWWLFVLCVGCITFYVWMGLVTCRSVTENKFVGR